MAVVTPIMGEHTGEETNTRGTNIRALADELGLASLCPVCLQGELKSITWNKTTPSWMHFACGHVRPPQAAGRHRLVEAATETTGPI